MSGNRQAEHVHHRPMQEHMALLGQMCMCAMCKSFAKLYVKIMCVLNSPMLTQPGETEVSLREVASS